MKIIIAGAGAVGFHLAELLTKENQEITLVDVDSRALAKADRYLDVLTVQGDATSATLLQELGVHKAKLFIAVTTSEKLNLLACMVAKQLGAKNTIARVTKPENFQKSTKELYLRLGIDVLISPVKLAAQEIKRLLHRASFTDHFDFEDGKISIVGFTLDNHSPFAHRSLKEVGNMSGDLQIRGIALLRGQSTIIPSKETILYPGDHLYIAATQGSLTTAMQFAGKQLKSINRIMILGDTNLALQTAQLLESTYAVTLVVKNKDRGTECVEELSQALVIHADPNEIDTLKEEGLEQMDAVISLTESTETNIITCLMAEQMGIYKSIALVENVNYTHISQDIGIDTMINKKLITANNIFRFVRKGKVEAIASLHGVNAEIIEFAVHNKKRLLKRSVRDLGFPKSSIIAGVIRGKETFLPTGDFRFELDDRVIVLAKSEAISKVEEIFQ